jgi:hypothetical protein
VWHCGWAAAGRARAVRAGQAQFQPRSHLKIKNSRLGWHPTAEERWFSLHILLLIFGFHSSHVYMLYAVFVMIIVLQSCYEVMNHYVPSHHYLFILL